jgi:outer membrane protein TolC
MRDFDEAVALEARQRLLDVDTTKAALVASDEAVAAATEARRVLGERFRAGVATSTELLDGDVALLQAELEHTQLQASLRIAEARLIRTAGGR